MKKEDVDMILDWLWLKNRDEFLDWLRDYAKTAKTLIKAEKQISALEQAKVLK